MTNSRSKEQIKEYKRQYAAKNKEKISRQQKAWRESHADYVREYQKKYYREHKATIVKQINKRTKERRLEDPIFRNKARVRARIRKLVNSRGGVQSKRTQDILGCDFEILWEYLLFTWKQNYGSEWRGESYEIDHFIPLATAKTPLEVEKLCHYSNLQMLTPEDNLKKGDKVEKARL